MSWAALLPRSSPSFAWYFLFSPIIGINLFSATQVSCDQITLTESVLTIKGGKNCVKSQIYTYFKFGFPSKDDWEWIELKILISNG